jgi:hypothetical protein
MEDLIDALWIDDKNMVKGLGLKVLLSVLVFLSNSAHAGYTVECASNEDAYIINVTGEVRGADVLVRLDLLFDDEGTLRQFNSDWSGCNENVNLVSDESDILLTCETQMTGWHTKMKYTVDRLVGKFTMSETYDNGNELVVSGRCKRSEYGDF